MSVIRDSLGRPMPVPGDRIRFVVDPNREASAALQHDARSGPRRGGIIQSMSVTQRDPIEIVFPSANECGPHVRLPNGNRVEVKAGERLFVRLDERGRIEHAWTVDDIERARLTAKEIAHELLERIVPALTDFVADAVKLESQLDNACSSKFELQLGVIGYDDEDNPRFEVRFESSHSKEV